MQLQWERKNSARGLVFVCAVARKQWQLLSIRQCNGQDVLTAEASLDPCPDAEDGDVMEELAAAAIAVASGLCSRCTN